MTNLRVGRSLATALALGAWMSSAACTKKDDAGRPSGVPALEPGAAPAAAPRAMAPAPAPPVAAAPAPAPAAPADPRATISGELLISPAVAKVKPKGVLYLVARRPSDNPSARGTMIAVKKFDDPKFPLAFSMSAADMPFQNGPFDGEMVLSARIDQDGDPISRQKGDVFGSLPKVMVGSQGVKLTIDQVQKEAESLAQPGAGMGGPMMGGGALPPGHPQ
jgi:hypothetical protein